MCSSYSRTLIEDHFLKHEWTRFDAGHESTGHHLQVTATGFIKRKKARHSNRRRRGFSKYIFWLTRIQCMSNKHSFLLHCCNHWSTSPDRRYKYKSIEECRSPDTKVIALQMAIVHAICLLQSGWWRECCGYVPQVPPSDRTRNIFSIWAIKMVMTVCCPPSLLGVIQFAI